MWGCANTAWPDCGIEVRSTKTHPVPEKRGSQKNTGQVGLECCTGKTWSPFSKFFFSVDLKVSAQLKLFKLELPEWRAL